MPIKLFHREKVFNNSQKAWETYKHSPGYFVFPERITVEITNRCNLGCFMCPRTKVKMRSGDMGIKLYKKITDEVSGFLPACLVPFFRGESLLHPRFLEMLSIAKKKGLSPIQMSTNAYFLTPQMSRSILDLGIDFISFSLDVNKPEIYKKIRINSDFERVFSNILYFLELKNKKNIHLPEVQVSAVKTKENLPFIRSFINFWKNRVERVRIYASHSLDGRLGYLSKADIQSKKLERKPCLKLLTDIVIYWDGNIAICNHDWQRNIFIGNVKKQSIEKIWSSAIYNKIRNKHLCNRLERFSPCNSCSHWIMNYNNNFIGELYENGKVASY